MLLFHQTARFAEWGFSATAAGRVFPAFAAVARADAITGYLADRVDPKRATDEAHA